MSAALDFEAIRHGYDGRAVLDGLSLHVPAGQVTCLLGPSGCGKTTLLRIAAGLERPWSGRVTLGGALVDGPDAHLPPERRRVGFVFQDFALFPHLTVLENVAFGMRGLPARERRDRAGDLLRRLGVADKAGVHPHLLSGGQQQRVALARALAPDPAILLLDEPFSGLDTVLRRGVYEELRGLLTQTGVTAVVVTHDPLEAMILGHRVVLMRDGRIEQQGTPEALYAQPLNPFVMRFLGEANVLPARRDGGLAVTALGAVAAPDVTGAACAMIRPERVEVLPAAAGPPLARVEARVFLGRATRLRLALADGTPLVADVPGTDVAGTGAAEGETVAVRAAAADLRVFPASESAAD
jgi:iron(III) transport system ATP-binding protein